MDEKQKQFFGLIGKRVATLVKDENKEARSKSLSN